MISHFLWYLQKLQSEVEQWKEKANKLQQKYDDLMSQKNELNSASLQLQEHNKELTARNEQLEYSMPQLNLENEHLREQIQNMIIASNEATKQHHRIADRVHTGGQHCDNSNSSVNSLDTPSPDDADNPVNDISIPIIPVMSMEKEQEIANKLKTPKLMGTRSDSTNSTKSNSSGISPAHHQKSDTAIIHEVDELKDMDFMVTAASASKMCLNKRNSNLLAIDDETDNILSDASNYEETEAALSSIRRQLSNSDERGRLMTKHQSQHSMDTIIDLVRKTKDNMTSQSIDLAIFNEEPSDDEDEQDEQREFNGLHETSMLTQSCDDSFSDRLGFIEEMIKEQRNDPPKGQNPESPQIQHLHSREPTLSVDNGDVDEDDGDDDGDFLNQHHDEQDKLGFDSMDEMAARTKHEEKSANIMHSDTDGDHENEEQKNSSFIRLSEFLKTPSPKKEKRSKFLEHLEHDPFGPHAHDLSSSSMSGSDTEPPFFQRQTLENDKSVVRKMLSNPVELTSIMSTILDRNESHIGSSSDWDCDHDADETLNIKKSIKKRRSRKVVRKRKKRESATPAISEGLELKEKEKEKGRRLSRRRRSKQLSQEELENAIVDSKNSRTAR